MEILAFVLVSIGVVVIPGPNVLVIVSTSLSHGRLRALQTVAGTSSAMIIQLTVAALGTSIFVASLMRGFWVSLTNPKTIFFFGAFLPQFTTPDLPFEFQIFVLSAIFWCIAVVLDSGYALLAWKCKSLLASQNVNKYQNGLSGIIYIAASAFLVGSKHSG